MKLIFRNKHNGRFFTPIEVLPNHVRMYHEPSDRVFWYKKARLHEHLQVVHHDVRVGVMLRSGKTQRGVLLTGLVNYTRVGRNYKLKRPGVEAKAITRTEHSYTTYDASKVMEPIRQATREIVNRFDAVTNAQRQAREYGVGFIRVEPDGSMKAIDPRSVILK